MAGRDKGNASASVVEHLGVRLDRERQAVSAGGRGMTLTATEYRLLQFLMERPGQVCTRAELMSAAIGGGAIMGERTIDVHIFGLRRKLGIPGFIQTIRGEGYVLKNE